ncbi:DedA family protein [Desulfurispora thermophila]|uniref:DedA family protein n=1 Tax=Desulfurispora thermophila TaxID=265470 RepID=UPI000361B05B|nr:VTT domain-containing protein [Desulfurispora thermophila]
MLAQVIDCLIEFGWLALFLGAVIEALGLPFPGSVMLVFAGVLISRERLGLVAAVLAAVVGYNVGGGIAYFLGRFLGHPLGVSVMKWLKIEPEQLEQGFKYMQRSAGYYILLGHFLPMFSNLTPYLAGVSRVRAGVFFLYNSAFAIIWAFIYMGAGFYFSSYWERAAQFLQRHIYKVAVLGLVLYIMVVYLFKKKKVFLKNSK